MKPIFYRICLLILVLSAAKAEAQMTLENCYRKAQANYPAIKKFELIERAKSYTIQNANRGYLPQITLSAKATYQSDVTQLPAAIGELAGAATGTAIDFSPGKDQYGATVDITQTVWDGGVLRHRKKMTHTEAASKQAENEVALYAVHRTVNEIYFGILLAEARIQQTALYMDELQRNLSMVEGCIAGGTAQQSDLDAIRAELLQARQNDAQWQSLRNAYIRMLAHITGERIDTGTAFATPAPTIAPAGIRRPELHLYDAQIAHLTAKQQSLNADLMPKFQLFVTGGYGRPALNMLNWDFKGYYVAGLRLSWNPSSLYTHKNSRRILDNSIDQVGVEREVFLYHTRMEMERQDEQLKKYREQLKYDNDIVTLRSSIKETSAQKMKNGILTGTEYMRDVTAEQAARQEKLLHEIELLKAMYDLKYVTNN